MSSSSSKSIAQLLSALDEIQLVTFESKKLPEKSVPSFDYLKSTQANVDAIHQYTQLCLDLYLKTKNTQDLFDHICTLLVEYYIQIVAPKFLPLFLANLVSNFKKDSNLGVNPAVFFVMRIRTHLEILVNAIIQKTSLQNQNPSICHLIEEDFKDIEKTLLNQILYALENHQLLQEQLFKVDESQQDDYCENISNFLTHKILALSADESYIYNTGWRGHSVSLIFKNNLCFIINGGDESRQRYPKSHPLYPEESLQPFVSPTEFLPRVTMTYSAKTASLLKAFFEKAILLPKKDKAAAIPLLYNTDARFPLPTLGELSLLRLPALPEQKVGNCVVHNWDLAMTFLFPNLSFAKEEYLILRRYHPSHDFYFREFIREHKLMELLPPRLKDRRLEISSRITYGSVDSKQKHPTSLTHLNLSNQSFIDEDIAELLILLDEFPLLESIDLSNNKITDAGAAVLASYFNKSKLIKIDLTNNPINSSVSLEKMDTAADIDLPAREMKSTPPTFK